MVGPLAEGRERWPGKNLAGSLPSSSGVDGDASLHLLCCAAARSYRHHDCQITVAIGHGRVTVNSQYFKGGETPASHRRTTYRGSTCLAGQVVMTPASSLHVQTAPRPLFHGGGLRGSEMGTAATHSLSEPARSGNRVSGADGREGHGGGGLQGG